MDNYIIKQVGSKYYAFINLGNGMTFPLPGEHDTEADAQAAYARWQSDDKDKRDYRTQSQPFEGTWG